LYTEDQSQRETDVTEVIWKLGGPRPSGRKLHMGITWAGAKHYASETDIYKTKHIMPWSSFIKAVPCMK
jgi:hypothetical protein